MRGRGYLDLTSQELRARRIAFCGVALVVLPPLLARLPPASISMSGDMGQHLYAACNAGAAVSLDGVRGAAHARRPRRGCGRRHFTSFRKSGCKQSRRSHPRGPHSKPAKLPGDIHDHEAHPARGRCIGITRREPPGTTVRTTVERLSALSHQKEKHNECPTRTATSRR